MATTRTDEIMKGTSITNSVNVGVTTKCTMKCPSCSIDVPARAADKTATHIPYNKILEELEVMSERGSFHRVHLTGGEPTIHPAFTDIVLGVLKLKRRGRLAYLTIETNGHWVIRYKQLFTSDVIFDRVFITHYVKDKIYPDNPDNTDVIAWAKHNVGDRLITEPPVEHLQGHLKIVSRQNEEDWSGYTCSKYFDPGLPCGLYDHLIYPCCVSVGIDRNLGIPVTVDWRDEIVKRDLGCSRCLYRGT